MLSTYQPGDIFLLRKSFNTFETNDLVYFAYPLTDSGIPENYCLQRLVGLPGDTVLISDKSVFLNNFQLKDTSTLQFNYYLKSTNTLDSIFRKRYKLKEGGEISKDFDYSFSLNRMQRDSLRADTLIKKIEVKMDQKAAFDETIFPNSIRYNWNRDQFGKLYLPKKGDTILLDSTSIVLYAKLITFHEGNDLSVKGDSIFINDKLMKKYRVKKNYYFTLGDNRDNAIDSRTWGLLPENRIKGKAVMLLKRNIE